MRTIDETQRAAVCGGTSGLFPNDWVRPSAYDLRTHRCIRARWDLWGPNRIGGEPHGKPL